MAVEKNNVDIIATLSRWAIKFNRKEILETLSVDGSSTDNERDQKEDASAREKEKQEGDVQSGSDITKQEADETVGSGSRTPQTQQGTTSAGEGTQTEEQPGSFFSSLFNILTKPFALIASFFSGFFSWLLDSKGEKADESISQSNDDISLPTSSSLDNNSYDTMNTSE